MTDIARALAAADQDLALTDEVLGELVKFLDDAQRCFPTASRVQRVALLLAHLRAADLHDRAKLMLLAVAIERIASGAEK